MALFKCTKCSASFEDEALGIIYCPYCFGMQPLPPNLSEEQKESIYNEAVGIADRAKSPENFEELISIFEQLDDYKDSRSYAASCQKKLFELKNDEIYTKALQSMEKETVRGYKMAIELLSAIPEWRNASFKLDEANAKLQTLLEKREQQKEKLAKIAMIACACVIAVAIITWLVVEFAVPAIRYSGALKQIKNGEYEEAYATLTELEDYKDSSEQIKKSKYERALKLEMTGDMLNACKLYGEATGYMDAETRQLKICKTLTIEEQLSVLNVGNTVIFGKYEQDADLNNDAEKLEWIIVEKNSETALLISKYALDASAFSSEPTTWSKSEIRQWLNSEDGFMKAFILSERPFLNKQNVTTVYKDAEGAEKIDICEDYVFLLSENEVNKYLSTPDEKCALATEYLKTKSVYINPNNAMTHYWLRSIAQNGEIMYVNGGGTVNQGGKPSDSVMSIRPAVSVKLK